jgi:hypothetical protein
LGLGPLIFGASKDLFARCNPVAELSRVFICSLSACSYTPVLALTGSGLLLLTLVMRFALRQLMVSHLATDLAVAAQGGVARYEVLFLKNARMRFVTLLPALLCCFFRMLCGADALWVAA